MVWNSFRSTLRDPSKRREAVIEETTIITVSEVESPNINQRTLSNQAVEVLIAGSLNAQITTADIINSLIINHETAVGVFQSGVGGQDGVVWLHNRRGNLRRGVDAKLKLALLAIVDRQTLHE